MAGTLAAGMVTTCAGDVSDDRDVARMVAATIEFGGKLNVLVNNAGLDPGGTITEVDAALWRKVIEVNLTGPFLLMKAAIPHMIGAGGVPSST